MKGWIIKINLVFYLGHGGAKSQSGRGIPGIEEYGRRSMLGSRERGGVVARGAGELPVASLVVTTVNSEQRRDVQRAGCDAASSKQRTGHDAASERAGMLSMGSR
jgi:hypothetical protein